MASEYKTKEKVFSKKKKRETYPMLVLALKSIVTDNY
jgi:hypothetical protein